MFKKYCICISIQTLNFVFIDKFLLFFKYKFIILLLVFIIYSAKMQHELIEKNIMNDAINKQYMVKFLIKTLLVNINTYVANALISVNDKHIQNKNTVQ
jgi:hypothetical protein